MITVTSTTEEKIVITIAPTTAAGNPAAVDGVPTYTLVEGDATLVPSEDGLSCEVFAGAADTINQILITADADLDEGEVRELTELVVYTVTAAEASNLGVSASVLPK